MISIAIATFNGEKYLPALLFSIMAQSTPPDEIIVSDDLSTDSTRDIISEFSRLYPLPIRSLCNNERLGFENNFLRALRACNGEYVFIADQDDIWLPNKISSCLDSISHNPSKELFIHDAIVCNENLAIIADSLFDISSLPLQRYSYGFAMTASSRLIQALPSGPISVGHDILLNEIACAFNSKFFVKQKLAIYRRHHNAHTPFLTSRKPSKPPIFTFCLSSHTRKMHFYQHALVSCFALIDRHPEAEISAMNYIQQCLKTIYCTSLRLDYMRLPIFRRYLRLFYCMITGKVLIHEAIKDLFSVPS